MYLAYGNYTHDIGECSFELSRVGKLVNGIYLGYTERWDVQGRLQVAEQGSTAADQAAIAAKILSLQQGYTAQGQDIVFYFDDGTPSAHVLRTASCAGGTRIVLPPFFPEGRGAECVTFRNYALAVEGDILDPTIGIIDWHESLTFGGGGQRWGFLVTLNGPPQPQILNQQVPWKASQQGEAIGMFGYPSPPAPIWAANEHVEQRSIVTSLPKRTGRGSSAFYTEYKVSWSYQFEAAVPLIGAPTGWPN